jgi:integrase
MVARWHREKMRLTDERAKAGDGPIVRGTLAADARTYLATATLSKQRKAEREDQLKWWCEAFGTRRRQDLEAPELRRALNGLINRGRDGNPLAPSTVNKYRFALSHVYTVLDGKQAANPLRDVPKYTEPDAEARDVSYEIIERIIDEIRDRGRTKESASLTKARVRVFAYAPVTPAQLRQMKRSDIDWEAMPPAMITPGRRKGQGTKPRRKPLTPLGLAAFHAFDAADGWEKPFSRSSLYRTFTAARDRAVAALRDERPDLDLTRAVTMHPYDLRHSFATVASRAIGNEAIVSEFLDHSDRRTTRRYTQGALPDHMRAAGEALTAAFTPPRPKQAKTAKTPKGSPRRTRVAPGIYRDAHGFSVIAKKGSGSAQLTSGEIRYPLTTDIAVLKARWLDEKQRLQTAQTDAGTSTHDFHAPFYKNQKR